jgi:TldD protein
VTGVFTHESFGHKSEADFMLGDDNLLKEWAMGKEVAAEIVSIVDEGDSFGTSGHCPFDDEGNKKKKTYLIKNGKLAGRLHSASTALALGEENTGNGRAMNFEFGPIVRMTNTYIEAGTQSISEAIAGIKKGVYIKDFKHGMGMSTFTIAPAKSYLIEDGKITKPVRVSVISGSVFETLKNISAVANDFEVKSSAFGGCGKFEQFPLPVADGGPSILVDGMQVS